MGGGGKRAKISHNCSWKKYTKDLPMCALSCFSPVQLFETLRTVTHQAPLSMGFSRQEYWSELPCPPPWGLPHPGMEPKSLKSPALVSAFFTTSTTREHFQTWLCILDVMVRLWPQTCLQRTLETAELGAGLSSQREGCVWEQSEHTVRTWELKSSGVNSNKKS